MSEQQTALDQIIEECAMEWQVPVSMLKPREPKTEQERQDAKRFADHIGERYNRAQCEMLCQRLQLAAMRSTSIILMVDYAGHVDTLTVMAYEAGTRFTKDNEQGKQRLLYRYVRLGADEAYGQLVAIADELESMGVEV